MYPRMTSAHYVTKGGPELLIHLPSLLESWDYNHVLPHPVYAMLEVEPRDSSMLGRDYQLNIIPSPRRSAFAIVLWPDLHCEKWQLFKILLGTGEMARWLKALLALEKDLGSVPKAASTRQLRTTYNSSFRVCDFPLLASTGFQEYCLFMSSCL